MSAPEIGLYVHIPFCRSKCHYCSFDSLPLAGEPPDDYIKAVLRQVETMAAHPMLVETKLTSLFIGGGTPTIYPAGKLAEIIRACDNAFSMADDAEISVETNPNSTDCEQLRILRQAGVNRISIGVQSFVDADLVNIGRTHSRKQALDSIADAARAGFENINIDLIYGLPDQTLDRIVENIRVALQQPIAHIAFYELMLEAHTVLDEQVQHGRKILPPEDVLVSMEEQAHRLLSEAGFERYEISNFARSGRRCRHNLNYWNNGPYLGLGAGAVSYLEGIRLKNVTRPKQFVEQIRQDRDPYAEAEILGNSAGFRETVIMGLRMIDGLELAGLEIRFGINPVDYYGEKLQKFCDHGLVEIENGRMRLSAKTLPVANQVLSQLV